MRCKENLKRVEKVNMRKLPIYLWQERVVYSPTCMTFPHRSYHWSARPGELDEAELSTFCHTFFAFFFLLGVGVGVLAGVLVHSRVLALRYHVVS